MGWPPTDVNRQRLARFAALALSLLLLDLWQWGALGRSRAPLRLAALRAPPHTAPWTPSAAQFASTETCSASDAHAASPAGLARKRRNVARMEALDRAGGGGAYLLAAQDPLRAPCGAGLVAGIDPARLPGVYADIGACLALAAAVPVTRFCEERTLFHTFWAGRPVAAQTAWALAAFLATQDPQQAILWVWSRDAAALAADPLLALLAPPNASGRIVFKQWDAAREAAGTALAAPAFTRAQDPTFYLDSDLLRVVALWRYGGVFFDADVLLLRDLGPLLGGEWAYQWGAHCSWANNAVVRVRARSALAGRLVAAVASARAPRKGSTAWGREAWARAGNFTRLPVCFFNPTWLTNFEGAAASLSHRAHPGRWRGAFAFHLHGHVYKHGPGAHPRSEYVAARRELLQLLAARQAAGGAEGWGVPQGAVEALQATLPPLP